MGAAGAAPAKLLNGEGGSSAGPGGAGGAGASGPAAAVTAVKGAARALATPSAPVASVGLCGGLMLPGPACRMAALRWSARQDGGQAWAAEEEAPPPAVWRAAPAGSRSPWECLRSTPCRLGCRVGRKAPGGEQPGAGAQAPCSGRAQGAAGCTQRGCGSRAGAGGPPSAPRASPHGGTRPAAPPIALFHAPHHCRRSGPLPNHC